MELKHLPVIIALSCLWLSIFILFTAILVINSGHMIYVIDDTYIHLAISKNLNIYSVFGVTRYEFSSSSSSPLWNLIISMGFLLIGVNDMVPLVLNIVFASLAVVVFYVTFKDIDASPQYITGVMLAFVFFTSLPGLVFTGMEHNLHIVLSLMFLAIASRILSSGNYTKRDSLLMLVVTLFASATRLETIFLVFPVVILFLQKRDWIHVITLLCAAALPWFAYGIVSIQNGWFLLPNSIIVKEIENLGLGIAWYFIRGLANLAASPFLLGLLLVSVKTPRFQDQGTWQIGNILKIIFVSSCLLHLQLGRVGWFFRYEAYLVAIGIFTVAFRGHQFISEFNFTSLRTTLFPLSQNKNRLITLALIVMFFLPLISRGVLCTYWTPIASNNIYNQQYQMALFLDRYYVGETVMMNDIGFANYLTDIVCIDKWGIGTLDIGQSWLNGSISAETIQAAAETHGVKIAAIYIDELVPEDWEIVGYWTIPNNVVAFNSTVAFIPVIPSERDRLIANLIEFSSFLPEDIVESGLYTTLA